VGVIAALAAAAALAAGPVQFLQLAQDETGAFAEPGGRPTVGLTAWGAIALRAAGSPAAAQSLAYLHAHESDLEETSDVAIAVLAEGRQATPALLDRLSPGAGGRIGPLLNSTAWSLIALAAAHRPLPTASVRYVLRAQTRAGGWGWIRGGGADSNDTAAAVEALRAAGIRGRAIDRGLAFLLRFRNRDGGFELSHGRGSDAQSTAWAIQAFLAAGRTAPAGALRYLARLRRGDGSYRYSARYATTPVWVTAQVVPAVLGKPFPLR
jgi:hypothetical protein